MNIKKNIKSDESTPLLDLLFNMLLIFFVFWVITMVNIQEEKAKSITTKAEFVITVTWPLNDSNDVDTWLQDPMGNTAFFRNKQRAMMHLDRDDLGSANDSFSLPDGTLVVYPYNQEIMTIRGIIPGEWILNIHLYRKNQSKTPTIVNVKMEKLNPSVRTIILKDIVLEEQWDEVTVSRFEMIGSGKIIGFDDTFKQLVNVGGPEND